MAQLGLPLVTCAVILFSALTLGETAAPKRVHLDSFSIIGIEARTTNAKEMAGNGVIAKQWQRFFQEKLAEKIPDRADQSIYAVYSDYASDRTGEYSFLIGVKVTGKPPVPAGMVLKTVASGDYAVLTSDQGPVNQVVPAAWQQVWNLEGHAHLGGKRAYRTDVEIYDQRAADPQNSQVDLYIGLK